MYCTNAKMMLGRINILPRFFSISSQHLNASKSHLGKLRKKTGYSFSNCKKALEENDNNVEKAEKWLHEQAKALGWAKASKLAGRKTSQGLVSISVEGNHAAMIEFNCETDFVARNKQFEGMAQAISAVCLNYTKNQIQPEEPFAKVFLDKKQLQDIPGPENKPLSDQIAILISSLGENLVVRRAACLSVDEKYNVAGFTHPSPSVEQAGSITGKFGGLLVYKDLKSGEKQLNVENVAKQLCQHVIGMNPKSIGSEEDIPNEDPEEETVMYHQDFLLDPSQSVGEVLTAAGIQPIDFVRFECGETVGDEQSESVNQESSSQQESTSQAASVG